ncbi:hypothetical protein O3P69_020138 [Scylla paramamosain]|uniref:Uncharacterized protein n=1 Tax=Scylla paramamosain TaxID=85552 RepID=A0AAW0TNV7_SCYPA
MKEQACQWIHLYDPCCFVSWCDSPTVFFAPQVNARTGRHLVDRREPLKDFRNQPPHTLSKTHVLQAKDREEE